MNRIYRFLMIFLVASFFVVSNVSAITDYSEMTDKELIFELEKLLTMDESVLYDSNFDITEFWYESQSIIKELKNRGYDLESEVIINDNSISSVEQNNGMPYETYLQLQEMYDRMASSPMKQVKVYGMEPHHVTCKSNLDLILKKTDGSPACVTPETAEKLIQRGWAIS